MSNPIPHPDLIELSKRAKILARPLKNEESAEDADSLSIMPFKLGQETYGIELKYIDQVYPLSRYISVPSVPDFILGITNIQARIYSIVDLKKFFSLPSSGLTNLNKLIILAWEEMYFGVLADEVYGTESVSLKSLGNIEDWKGSDTRFIQGVTPNRTVLIDAKALLQEPTLLIDQRN